MVRGRGMLQGLEFEHKELAGTISKKCFGHDLIIETAGPDDEVLKLMPPLVIDREDLEKGLDIIDQAMPEALAELGVSSRASGE